MTGVTTDGTATRARSRRLLTTVAVAALAATLCAGPARADTLADLRARSQQAQSQAQVAQSEIGESRAGLDAATQRLADSQGQLSEAEALLADTQVQLSAARQQDARLGRELARAQDELDAARAEVARGEEELAAQVRLIAQAARESYQRASGLVGLSVAFGSESTAELGQRLQWNTTVLDTQAAEKARLDEIQRQLEAARDRAAELERRVAEAKAEAEVQVARVAQLERLAAEQRTAVASLVEQNESARAAAQAELEADEAAYRAYSDEEARLQQEIQAELARLRAEEERRQAEEARRRAEEARRAQEAARAAVRPATVKPPASDRPAVSATGFIRPVAAEPGSRFGMRFHPILHYWRPHNGVDFGAAIGTPIRAARAGTVIKAGPTGGFGNFVLIGHGDIKKKYATTGYAHQSRIVVSVGQRVEQGQVIGYVGNTGLSTTPHLHFEVRLDGVAVNPLAYIP